MKIRITEIHSKDAYAKYGYAEALIGQTGSLIDPQENEIYPGWFYGAVSLEEVVESQGIGIKLPFFAAFRYERV